MKTVMVNTAEIGGAALDWAVGVSINDGKDGTKYFEAKTGAQWGGSVLKKVESKNWNPSENWSQGGPLIEKYIGLFEKERNGHGSYAETADANPDAYATGQTLLIAAMRAIVAAKLGDTVEIPEELVK